MLALADHINAHYPEGLAGPMTEDHRSSTRSARIPTARSAVVEEWLVREWRVYAGNSPVVAIMERGGSSHG